MKIAFIQKIKLLSAALAAYFTTKPEPVRCHNIKQLVRHLCDHDEAKVLWLLRWLAFPLKNPGARMDSAVLAIGAEGTGKSMLFERVMAAIYERSAAVIKPDQLTGHYNYWAHHTRYTVVNGDLNRHQVAQVKSYITARSLIIQAKGQLPVECANRLNFVFVSGDLEYLPDHLKDRRFFLVDAPPPMTQECYRAIAYEIATGGVDAFFDYLMRDVDMGDFTEKSRPPAAYQAEAA